MFPNWFKDVEHYFERHVPKVPLRALQIGTYTGDATMWLLHNRELVYLHDVDTWEGSDETAHDSLNFSAVEDYYLDRIGDEERILQYKMTSDQFFNLKKSSYNFIYIDGDHTALQTALDGLNAFRFLEPGGVMAFDDYQWHYGGEPFLEPKRGVDAFLSVVQDKVTVIESGYQVWIEKC